MASSSTAPSKAYQVLDIMLKLVSAASLLGILIVFTLRTAKLETHISNIEDNLSDISYLRQLSRPLSSDGVLVVRVSSDYSLPGSKYTIPFYVRNA